MGGSPHHFWSRFGRSPYKITLGHFLVHPLLLSSKSVNLWTTPNSASSLITFCHSLENPPYPLTFIAKLA